MINTYTSRASQAASVDPTLDVSATPPELLKWLSEKLIADPDYYLDEVYEALKAKYRPVLRINPETLLPEYDETHRVILERILDRFYEYEDLSNNS